MSDIQTPEFGLGDESKKTTVEQVEDDIEYTSIVVGGVAMVTAFFGGVFGGGAFLKRGNMVIRHLDALESKERRLAEGGYRHPEVTAAAAAPPPPPPPPPANHARVEKDLCQIEQPLVEEREHARGGNAEGAELRVERERGHDQERVDEDLHKVRVPERGEALC